MDHGSAGRYGFGLRAMAQVVSFDTRSVREAARSAARELGYPDLKPEQLKVIETFAKGRDVFAVLPTGYGRAFAMDVSRLCSTSYWAREERALPL